MHYAIVFLYNYRFIILEWAVELQNPPKLMLEVVGTAEGSLLEVLGYVYKLCSYKILHLLTHSSSDSSACKILKFHRMKNIR